ncbi:MAG: NmrA family NAD(P)-binding protein [Chloroflexota bacterium]
MKILVTGASGKTGRAVVNGLSKHPVEIRAWARRAFDRSEQVEPFMGDMQSPADWETALSGIDKLYHICPNMHPREIKIGQMGLSAASAAGVRHFVYHSVLHPQVEEMPHHWNKMRVEELLFASGIPFTIVQPTAYMQNLGPQLQAISQTGALQLPYPPETRISLIDLQDLAEAVAVILTADAYVGATLELVGTRPLSQHEVAAEFSMGLDQPVVAEEINLAEWAAGNPQLPEYTRETLLAMFRYYANYGLVGSPAVLKAVLGREPTSLADWIRSTR